MIGLKIISQQGRRAFASALFLALAAACSREDLLSPIDHQQLSTQYFGADAQWYLDNVPFFECSDKEIEAVYYYRWKLYKAHLRHVGENEFVITEFINDVHWDRDPYSTINAATMHHIYEGRWLKDDRYMNAYINYMYQGGGNNRSYSEGIADAAYARYLVNADSGFIIDQLEKMKLVYNQWSDHWEADKKLYYIPAMPDATEYTIASIDASGGKGGFEGGDAFRPTINSYMYGNAMAISKISYLKGDTTTGRHYLEKARSLKQNVEGSLWNDSLHHFTDRYKVNNGFVRYWNFIRGRELAGMVPWFYNLPADEEKFSAAWRHVLDTTQLLGRFGLRTNEPSYEFYFKQFVFTFGKPGSQWNGPSWPYQSSQVITAMGNLLNNYKQDVVSKSDYLDQLRLFTKQHYLPDGKINLVENYDPNKGGPIVFFYWSNHYNHSSYNNLVITGLCGIRPDESDTLTINPLIDDRIQYFCLDDVRYHGRKLTVIYDKEGDRYKIGRGLTVLVDGKKKNVMEDRGRYKVTIGARQRVNSAKEGMNYALNIQRKGYPQPTSSINAAPDSIYQAIDGRIWYFPEISNRWSTEGSASSTDWYAIDFGQLRNISSIKMHLYTDDKDFGIPEKYVIEYKKGSEWIPVYITGERKLTGNTENRLTFNTISAKDVRITFTHETRDVALVEFECYR